MEAKQRPKRPWRVTMFSLLVLLLGSGLNLARATWALGQTKTLADLSLSTSMPRGYLFGTSLVWGLVFGGCSFALWRLRRQGRIGTLLAVTLFHAHIWFNHIVFDRSDYARQVWPFAIVHSLVALSIVWGFLNWPAIKYLYDGREKRVCTGEDE